MERITSFSVDHRKLTKGVYVSRVDGDLITYDIRMTQPNVEPALKPEAAHTIEHIASWNQEIPGAKEEECGNYTFMDLEEAKKAADYFVNSKWEHKYHLL